MISMTKYINSIDDSRHPCVSPPLQIWRNPAPFLLKSLLNPKFPINPLRPIWYDINQKFCIDRVKGKEIQDVLDYLQVIYRLTCIWTPISLSPCVYTNTSIYKNISVKCLYITKYSSFSYPFSLSVNHTPSSGLHTYMYILITVDRVDLVFCQSNPLCLMSMEGSKDGGLWRMIKIERNL